MRLFLQINIGHWQQEQYEKPLLTFASSLADDVLGTDLDNQSDPYVVGLVRQLMDQAASTFVLVRVANENQPLDALMGLINQMFALETKLHSVVIEGKHQTLERMLGALGDRVVLTHDPEIVKQRIEVFAKAVPD